MPEISPETFANGLLVSVPGQWAELRRAHLAIWGAPVSTSAFGVGCEPGSNRTPSGLHRVSAKFGDFTPVGAIFESRIDTGRMWDFSYKCIVNSEKEMPGANPDLILSRILWLEGLEDRNRSTHERYIYIHGTNHEELIGQPASHGCIRVATRPLLKLYELMEVGTQVLICE